MRLRVSSTLDSVALLAFGVPIIFVLLFAGLMFVLATLIEPEASP